MMRILFFLYSLSIPFLCFGGGIPFPTPFRVQKQNNSSCFSKAIPSNDVLAQRADYILSKGEIGLSRSQLISVFLRIEGGTPCKKDKLPCRIENSKKLHKYVIRDIKSKAAYIGRGFHKKVKKAIIYGQQPQVIADCVSDDSARQEIVFLKKLRGVEGIVKFYGSVKRGKKYSIYLEYFQQGSLLHKFNNNESVEPYALKIAYDIAKGLSGMHRKKLVHRDLHAGNVLLEISDTYCKAVLVDFGKTLFVSRAKSALPQIPKTKNPPEGLIKKFSKIDRYKADIYGLGCLFYQMVTGEQNPWSATFNIYRVKKYKSALKKKYYEKIVSSYQATKERFLGGIFQKQQNGESLTSKEKFLVLTFAMINFDPKLRPSIDQVVSTLSELQ